MDPYHTLANHPLVGKHTVAVPDAEVDIGLDSPALTLFTDFEKHRPLLIESTLGIMEAEAFMKKAHVKLKLVIDTDANFLGTLSFADLYGERVQHLIGQGTPRPDITIRQVMTTADELRAIDYDDLANASVGDIVETLKQERCQHFLVVEPKSHMVRGIFSASDLARRLHVPLDISHSPTFADICHVVYQHGRRAER